jgi:hypothetical protein
MSLLLSPQGPWRLNPAALRTDSSRKPLKNKVFLGILPKFALTGRQGWRLVSAGFNRVI